VNNQRSKTKGGARIDLAINCAKEPTTVGFPGGKGEKNSTLRDTRHPTWIRVEFSLEGRSVFVDTFCMRRGAGRVVTSAVFERGGKEEEGA